MDCRWIIAALYVLGLVLTVAGLALAYLGARKQLKLEDRRIDESRQLAGEERAAMDARKPEQVTAEYSATIYERFEAQYAARDLIRPTYDNLPYLAAFEARRLAGIILDGSRGNLSWAGVGVILSTAASVWSLWPAAC